MLTIKRGWKTRWIAALRSGKYRQANNALIHRVTKNKKQRVKGYCCLGVLARIEGAKFNSNVGPHIGDEFVGDISFLNESWCGIDRDMQSRLANMNDSGDYDFKKIAAFIKKNVKVKKA